MASAATEKMVSPTAFVLSLASGVLIILGGILPWLFFANFQASPMGGMMGGWGMGPWFMGGWLFPLPLIAGAIVLFAALMMNTRPQDAGNWAVIVLVFSVLGLVGMGISTLGGIIGIVGGATAVSERR